MTDFWKRLVALKGLVALAVGVVLCGPAMAQRDRDDESDAAERGKIAVGVTGGTLGVGAEMAVKLHPNFILRATGSSWSLSEFVALGNDEVFFVSNQPNGLIRQNFEYAPSVTSAGVLLDVHAFRDGGRFSAGLRYLNYEWEGKLDASSAVASHVKIGSTIYTAAQAGTVTAKITNSQTILPYIGLGYDAAFFKSYGLSISMDAGVIVGGEAKVVVNTTGAAVSQGDRDAAAQRLKENEGKLFNYWPVLMLSAKYRF